FDIAIRRYEVVDGLIAYDDRKIPLNLRGENLRATMSLGRGRYTGDLASRRIRVMMAGYPPVEVDVAASFALNKSAIELKQVRITTGQSRAEFTGVLNDPRSPHGNLAVRSTVAIRDAVDLLHLPIARNGTATLDGQLSVALNDFGVTGKLT